MIGFVVIVIVVIFIYYAITRKERAEVEKILKQHAEKIARDKQISLSEVEEKIQKWKKDGYDVSEIEQMLEEIKNE